MTPALRTARLELRPLTPGDAPFLLRILNDPDFVRFVGDRGVRTVEQAGEYLRERMLEPFARDGYGQFLVRVAATGEAAGTCGLLKRDALDDVDLGFAFLPAFRGRGYAREAAAAVLEHARDDLGIPRVVAITAPDNDRSARLLEQLGLRFERTVQLEPGGTALRLFVPAADAGSAGPGAPGTAAGGSPRAGELG